MVNFFFPTAGVTKGVFLTIAVVSTILMEAQALTATNVVCAEPRQPAELFAVTV